MALLEIYYKWFRGFVQNKQDPVLHVYIYCYKVITLIKKKNKDTSDITSFGRETKLCTQLPCILLNVNIVAAGVV